MPGYAAHLAGALEQFRVGRTQLVTHDFGGGWDLAWAARHPQQVASLTLMNTGVTLGYKCRHYAARIWQTPVVGEIFDAAHWPFVDDPQGVVDALLPFLREHVRQ